MEIYNYFSSNKSVPVEKVTSIKSLSNVNSKNNLETCSKTSHEKFSEEKLVDLYRKESLDKGVESTSETSLYQCCSADSNLLRKSSSSIYFSTTRCNKNESPFKGRGFDLFNIRPRIFKMMLRLGFHQTSIVQEKVFPLLLSSKVPRCIVQSQSGTGKTLAYVAAMLTRVAEKRIYPQFLCVEPTSELVYQTYDLALSLAHEYPEIRITILCNDETRKKYDIINKHIIIAEVGKNLERHIYEGLIPMKLLKMVIYDEADLLLENTKYHNLISIINSQVSNFCQTFYFSATFSNLSRYIISKLSNVCVAEIKPKMYDLIPSHIKQFCVICKQNQKIKAIKAICASRKNVLIFVFTSFKETIINISKELRNFNIPNYYIIEENEADDRIFIYRKIIGEKTGVIISSDVWSRGINLNPRVVINYDLCEDKSFNKTCNTYLHRIGRTGRFERDGTAFTLVESMEEEKLLHKIIKHFNGDVKYIDINELIELKRVCS